MIFSKQIASIILLFFCVLGFSQNEFGKKQNKIDSLMKAHLVNSRKKPVHNFLLYAENNKTGFNLHKGVGYVKRKNIKVDEHYQYNIASITKTLVATIILQLEEEGLLNIDDKAQKYLGKLEFIRFDDLHLVNSVSYSKDITIKMLLNHTSGIGDVFIDAQTRFNISVLLNPQKQYTAKKFFKKYYQYGLNKKPHNKPGKGYYYSDINYMLLGFIIEDLTGKSLPEAIRNRILEPLEMGNTYFEFYEPISGNHKRIDAYLNRINITKKVNTSYEWGGGGLVSNTKDIAVFIKALFELKLFDNDNTLVKMIDISDTKKYGKSYGLGIFEYQFNGLRFYGHGGFYGSFVAYAPREKILLSANINQANPPYNSTELINAVIGCMF